jgi:hypothetical protein
MQQLILLLLQHIANQFPNLSFVAEDCGQLETQEDQYPVTFPCVLIGNTDIDWYDLREGGGSSQRGTATISVRLAIDCYDDVHVGSTQEASIAERLQLASDLHRALQGIAFTECRNVWPLTRAKSRDYTLPGYIKVYESLYRFTVLDQ